MDAKVAKAIAALRDKSSADIKEKLDALVEEAITLTGSQIGYFAIYNEGIRTLIMIGWSKTAIENCAALTKPLLYPLEITGLWGDAVREGGPVVTNDYATCTRPTKRGYPQGHVPVIRHANLPVWDDEKIVGVLGVGNKPVDYTEADIQNLSSYVQQAWQDLRSISGGTRVLPSHSRPNEKPGNSERRPRKRALRLVRRQR
jgi:two-component system, OmpR family, phosphate regulon sensor histidine kinase PhoR